MPTYGKQNYNFDSKINSSRLKGNSNLKFSPNKVKVPQKDLLIFFRQLAVIIQSGVPLAQGLELLAENTKNESIVIRSRLLELFRDNSPN